MEKCSEEAVTQAKSQLLNTAAESSTSAIFLIDLCDIHLCHLHNFCVSCGV